MSVTAPPAAASNVDLMRWLFERLNAHDSAGARQLWSEETVERFPDRTCRGADEIANYFDASFAALPDWRMEIEGIAAEGDAVFVRWRLTGTHAAAIFGIEPTGRRIEVDGIDHFTIREGRVVSNFVVFDQMQFARQIGMLPPDGSAADRVLRGAFNLRTRLLRLLGHRGRR